MPQQQHLTSSSSSLRKRHNRKLENDSPLPSSITTTTMMDNTSMSMMMEDHHQLHEHHHDEDDDEEEEEEHPSQSNNNNTNNNNDYRTTVNRKKKQQQQQHTTSSNTSSSNNTKLPKTKKKPPKLMTISETDQLFKYALVLVIPTWIFLLIFVYAIGPEPEYLTGSEQKAAMAAFCIFAVSIVLSLLPVWLQKARMSGILMCLISIQCIALTTNALLAFFPVVVMKDPITYARVFFVRWCEWIPLSGLMTFLSEGVDFRVDRRGIGIAVPFLVGLGQSLSCLCGIVLPFCPGIVSWSLVMALSFIFYFTIFPRVLEKRQFLLEQSIGCTVSEVEIYARIKTAYDLLLTCSIFWTVLVIIYFIPMIGLRCYPIGHWMHNDSFAMVCDTFFDVLAKCLYMRIILEVHETVFDSDGRTRRHLSELRKMMSALWETSSDVIVISVRNADRVTTMLSPTFATMVGSTSSSRTTTTTSTSTGSTASSSSPNTINNTSTTNTNANTNNNVPPVALVVDGKIDELEGFLLHPEVYFVDATSMPYPIDDRTILRTEYSQAQHGHLIQEAHKIADILCKSIASSTMIGTTGVRTGVVVGQSQKQQQQLQLQQLQQQQQSRTTTTTTSTSAYQQPAYNLLVHNVTGMNGQEIKCELKLTQQDPTATIAIVRDVTERYLRFEAERRAHSEALARQKDAQTVNRFTRHEIKNGLLAGIEVCDYLRNAMEDMKSTAGLPQQDSQERLTTTDKEGGPQRHQQQNSTQSQPPNWPSKSGHQAGFSRYVNELDGTLHEILDTVLAEAMARDVVHEVYQPKLERVDVMQLLNDTTKVQQQQHANYGSGGGGSGNSGNGRLGDAAGGSNHGDNNSNTTVGRRFQVKMQPPNMPLLSMDPQLLKYIHRNAVSNACKYGAKNGTVLTIVRFWSESNDFELDVVNEPGEMNGRLVEMGREACDLVFQQGKRLHNKSDDNISSGDGAWIMQRCAKTLGGFCSIRFEPTQTVFSFRCYAEAYTLPWQTHETFEVPPGTWGVGIDDSAIQRRLLSRVLTHVGVESSKKIVCGKTPEESEGVEQQLMDILENHPPHHVILALIDENLDYADSHGIRLSGSKMIQQVLAKLEPSQEARVLALIRSANDSADDISLYRARVHGFFPKASMRKERAREILAPLWRDRFPTKGKDAFTLDEEDEDDDDEPAQASITTDLITKDELVDSLARVQVFLKNNPNPHWDDLWSKLHVLKGDLMVTENNDPAIIAEGLINDLRGGESGETPHDFPSIWLQIQAQILEAAELLSEN